MKHILSDNYSDILIILNEFFQSGLSRKSKPKYNVKYKKELFDFVCKIYKRGFISQKNDLNFTKSIPIPTIINEFELMKVLNSFNKETVYFFVDRNLYEKQKNISYYLKDKNYLLYSPDETTKSLETVKSWIEILPHSTELLFVMGGGIILDMVGFVAGLLNIKVNYLSTTLLASVDAGIGGKTGVNFYPYGKNQVGLFNEAEKIFCNPEYFQTLTFENIICGLVEAIKQSWIFGEFANDYEAIQKIYQKQNTNAEFLFLVNKNIRYKAYVVNLDLHETKDIRSSLNFGHTLAHILEALGEETYLQTLPHGIAVAHGLYFLVEFNFISISSKHEKMFDIIQDIIRFYPIKIVKDISLEKIESYLMQDKKNEDNKLCQLSLPKYGHFSLDKNTFVDAPITQKYKVTEISDLLFKYIHKN
nr:3-dehydroquinate synthase family protein [Pigmentibacter ruber]